MGFLKRILCEREGSSERSREKRKEIENRRRTGILIPERREEDGALKKLPDRRPPEACRSFILRLFCNMAISLGMLRREPRMLRRM